jgi:predicted small secreted protein
MKNTLKIGLTVALVLAMSLSVAGCTSNTSTSGQALTLTATQVPVNESVTDYYGANAVAINATITNNNAGTFKLSSDNFFLTDSSGHIEQPVSPTTSDVSDSGNWITTPMYFQITQGTTPATLRYYDGTHDISCSVS